MARLTEKQLAKLTPAERKQREKMNAYKKAYHAKRKAEGEKSNSKKRAYHAAKKAEKNAVETVLDRVEILVTELKVTETKRDELMSELREIFSQE